MIKDILYTLIHVLEFVLLLLLLDFANYQININNIYLGWGVKIAVYTFIFFRIKNIIKDLMS